jgi:hypothetical protein
MTSSGYKKIGCGFILVLLFLIIWPFMRAGCIYTKWDAYQRFQIYLDATIHFYYNDKGKEPPETLEKIIAEILKDKKYGPHFCKEEGFEKYLVHGHIIDPGGHYLKWDLKKKMTYTVGPNGIDEGGNGDDR